MADETVFDINLSDIEETEREEETRAREELRQQITKATGRILRIVKQIATRGDIGTLLEIERAIQRVLDQQSRPTGQNRQEERSRPDRTAQPRRMPRDRQTPTSGRPTRVRVLDHNDEEYDDPDGAIDHDWDGVMSDEPPRMAQPRGDRSRQAWNPPQGNPPRRPSHDKTDDRPSQSKLRGLRRVARAFQEPEG